MSIKYRSQIISAEGGPFRLGILKLLASFRSTAPENGKSPSELLFGWKIRSDSDIRNPALLKEGEVKRVLEDVHSRQLDVEERRQIVNDKFQKRRYGRDTVVSKFPYRVGDFVCTRLPIAEIRKGQPPFSPPKQVIKVLGKWKYRLSDGSTWNARQIIRFHPKLDSQSFEQIDEEFMAQGP